MKKNSPFILMISLLHSSIHGQVNDTVYKVATWKGFAQAAVSYTWDDNTAKQLSDALPLYDRYDFKATFFPITSTNPNWSGLKKAQSNGHEIGSHTLTHTALNTLSDTAQETEQKNSRAEINAQLMNKKCLTLAYPYCAIGNRSITSNYYMSARGCNGQVEKSTPADFLNVGSIICGAQGAVNTAAQFNTTVNNATVTNGWVVFLLHGINNDGGYSPVDSVELSKHLEYMNANKNKFWVSTYGATVRYIRERDAVVAQELANTDSLIIFSLSHNLDTTIYNIPLTLKRSVPHGWNTFLVYQHGKVIPATIKNENGTNYMIFDVIPSSGNVWIRNTTTSTGVEKNEEMLSFTVYPNPFHICTTIQFVLEHAAKVSLELLDGSGKKVRIIPSECYSAGLNEISLNSDGLNGNVFYCVLRVNGKVAIRKIIYKV